MNDADLQRRLMERMLAARTPWGRFRLGLRVRLKRFAWRFVVGGASFAKRLFDIVVAAIALMLLVPVMLVIALLVRRDGGPVFFKQTRVGLDGREFKMLKYRSMCVDAEAKLKDLLAQNEKAQGVTFKMKDDPRITRVGRVLRKSSLDELPQFLNVLRGEMSIVGPRPPIPREVALYQERDRRRLAVKPGITCLWQVGEREGRFWEIGDRNEIDFDEQVGLDVRYIESQHFWKDLWILLKTVPAILFGKGM